MTGEHIHPISFNNRDVIKVMRGMDVNKSHISDNIPVKVIDVWTNTVIIYQVKWLMFGLTPLLILLLWYFKSHWLMLYLLLNEKI